MCDTNVTEGPDVIEETEDAARQVFTGLVITKICSEAEQRISFDAIGDD